MNGHDHDLDDFSEHPDPMEHEDGLDAQEPGGLEAFEPEPEPDLTQPRTWVVVLVAFAVLIMLGTIIWLWA